jgi:predicted nucleic acid-binding protein
MPYLLDTNHCIYFLNGLEKALEKRSVREQQVLTQVLACALIGNRFIGSRTAPPPDTVRAARTSESGRTRRK